MGNGQSFAAFDEAEQVSLAESLSVGELAL